MNQKLIQLIILCFLMFNTAACSSSDSPLATKEKEVVSVIQATLPQSIQPSQESKSTQIQLAKKTTLPTNTPIPAISPTETLFPEEVLHSVTDEYGAIQAILPVAWNEMRNEPWVNNKNQIVGTTFIAATNINDFINLKAEGVAISVSNRLGMGYIQLLDEEVKIYKKICEDTYKTTWTTEDPVYRGKHVVLGCSSNPDSWLDVEVLVNKQDPAGYIVRIIALDMVPTYGDKFREIVRQFQIFPENIP